MYNPQPPGISYFPFHGLYLLHLQIIDRVPLKINCSHLKTQFFNVAKCNLGKVNLEAMLVSSFPSYTRGGPMPLAGAPRDLYTQLLACSSSQSVVAIACCLRATLCFGFCLLAVSACTMTAR